MNPSDLDLSQVGTDTLHLILGGIMIFAFALPVSVPLGLAFGISLAAPMGRVGHHCEEATLTGHARVQIAIGLFLAAMPLPIALATFLPNFDMSDSPPLHPYGFATAHLPLLGVPVSEFEHDVAVALVLTGAALCCVGALRLLAARIWLTRVQHGRLPEWEVAPMSRDGLEPLGILPFSAADRHGTRVLLRLVLDPTDGPYRARLRRVPWLRVR